MAALWWMNNDSFTRLTPEQRQIVLDGWALADPADGEAYRRAEQAARGLKEGLWKGRFVTPWEWREGARLPPPAAD